MADDFAKEFDAMVGALGDENLDIKSTEPEEEVIDMEELATKTPTGEEAPEGRAQAGGTEGQEEEASVSQSEKDQELEQLKQTVADLQKKLNGEEPPAEPPAEEESVDLKPEVRDLDLFETYSFEDISGDEDKFKAWAGDFAKKVQEATQEAIYQRIPKVVDASTKQKIDAQARAAEFYANNADLANHKSDVAKAANVIASTHPELKGDQYMEKVADYTRYVLGLERKTKEKEGKEEEKPPAKESSKQSPALNNRTMKSSTRTQPRQESLEGVEKEIDDMIKAIDR